MSFPDSLKSTTASKPHDFHDFHDFLDFLGFHQQMPGLHVAAGFREFFRPDSLKSTTASKPHDFHDFDDFLSFLGFADVIEVYNSLEAA